MGFLRGGRSSSVTLPLQSPSNAVLCSRMHCLGLRKGPSLARVRAPVRIGVSEWGGKAADRACPAGAPRKVMSGAT